MSFFVRPMTADRRLPTADCRPPGCPYGLPECVTAQLSTYQPYMGCPSGLPLMGYPYGLPLWAANMCDRPLIWGQPIGATYGAARWSQRSPRSPSRNKKRTKYQCPVKLGEKFLDHKNKSRSSAYVKKKKKNINWIF